MFLFPEDVDSRLNWKPGRTERLARQRRLPHYVLPDGSIRFISNPDHFSPCHAPVKSCSLFPQARRSPLPAPPARSGARPRIETAVLPC